MRNWQAQSRGGARIGKRVNLYFLSEIQNIGTKESKPKASIQITKTYLLNIAVSKIVSNIALFHMI